MEFPGFFSYAAQYFFKEIQALRFFLFAGEKQQQISSLDLSIELNRCGGGSNLDAKCPASMEIVLEHFDHILGGRAELTCFFTGRNMPKKNGEPKKGGEKIIHPRKMFKDFRVMTSVDENVWDQLRCMIYIYIPKFKKSWSIYHINW